MLISTLLGKGVGATGKPGHFRTLFPFSVSGKTVVGLLLRRRTLYPTEVQAHGLKMLSFQWFLDFSIRSGRGFLLTGSLFLLADF